MDDSQFMLQGERRYIDHPHTRNVPQRKSPPESIHQAVVRPYSLLSFGDLPRDVVCSHEGSTGQSCSHRIDHEKLATGGERLGGSYNYSEMPTTMSSTARLLKLQSLKWDICVNSYIVTVKM